MKPISWYRRELKKAKTEEERKEMEACIRFLEISKRKQEATDALNNEPDGDKHTEMFQVIQDIQAEQRKALVPACRINHNNITTHFSLNVSGLWDKVGESCFKWYDEHYVQKKYPGKYLGNLIANVDYIFSLGLKLIDLYETFGFAGGSSFNHFRDMYIMYEEKGIHQLIGYCVDAYNGNKKRPFTKKELKEREDRANSPETKAMIDGILAELKAEEDLEHSK